MYHFSRSLLLLGGLLFSITAIGQEKPAADLEPTIGVIKWNPIGIFATQWQFGYEHVLNPGMSAQATLGFIGTHRVINKDTLEGFARGFIFIPEFRFYINKSAPKGLYVAPFLRFKYTSEKQSDLLYAKDKSAKDYSRQSHVNSFALGAVLGYQYYQGRFTFDVFGGLQQKFASESISYNSGGISDQDFKDRMGPVKMHEKTNFGFRMGISIGFRLQRPSKPT
jgi:hypothetical protein